MYVVFDLVFISAPTFFSEEALDTIEPIKWIKQVGYNTASCVHYDHTAYCLNMLLYYTFFLRRLVQQKGILAVFARQYVAPSLLASRRMRAMS